MTRSTRPFSSNTAAPQPAYLKLQRALLAACIVLAPLVLGIGLGIAPGGGLQVPSDPAILVAQFQQAGPLQVQWFLYLNALVVYFFPLSFIGMGLVAMQRSAWPATLGMIFGLAGSLPYGMFLGEMTNFATVAKLGNTQAYQTLLIDFHSDVIRLLALSWVLGHLLGYVLLGIALARSRAVPLWAAALFIVAIPFQMAGYVSNQPWLQNICFALIFVGSVPVALAMLNPPAAAGAQIYA